MHRATKLGLAAVIALGLAGLPVQAQNFSDGYKFLKAVKERNGADATAALNRTPMIVNSKDGSNGDTGLHLVTRDRDFPWLNFLLSEGAKADVPNKDGNTPLVIATQIGWQEGAALLLRVGAKVNLANNRGETPLMFAVQKRDVPMVRLLLSKGADPKRADSVSGYSALDYARRDPRAASILKMLEAPATAPARPKAGPGL